jgi:spermidine dehydrogenase
VQTYPPSQTGLQGQHQGAFSLAHQMAFKGLQVDISSMETEAAYDFVVVGGGISGLAAAHFYRQRFGADSRILVIDCLGDVGGHAKRNEFYVDGKRLLGYGGSESFQSPRHSFSEVNHALLTTLGVDLSRFETEYFRPDTYPSLGMTKGSFFSRENFGSDTLVTGDPTDMVADDLPRHLRGNKSLADFIAGFPLSENARRQLTELYTDTRRVTLEQYSVDQRIAYLESVSYHDFLAENWQLAPEASRYFHARTLDFFALPANKISALEAGKFGYPGLQGIALPVDEEARAEMEELYVHHFPDGNASIARLLVRQLIPAALPGSSPEDALLASLNYAALADPAASVQIRLNATAMRVRPMPDGCEIGYISHADQQLHKVRARHCTLACFSMILPFIVDGLPAEQAQAHKASVKAPLVYTNVAVRNWHPWQKLGVHEIFGVDTFHSRVKLDYPVTMGSYRHATHPDEPVLIHMVHVPHVDEPMDPRDALRAARKSLFALTLDKYEVHIRNDLERMLGPGGFDFDRDVAAFTVNRWSHGYAWSGNTLSNSPEAQALLNSTARQALGHVTIANSDAGGSAYMHVAIDEAWRAVQELPA